MELHSWIERDESISVVSRRSDPDTTAANDDAEMFSLEMKKLLGTRPGLW